MPTPQYPDGPSLKDTCSPPMTAASPSTFSLKFHTSYGDFTASCVRSRYPAQVDRVYNLARLGYYSQNYFFRVVDGPRISIVQFGTSGLPDVSNVYNYESTDMGQCAVVQPQPAEDVIGIPMETNGRGWISMR